MTIARIPIRQRFEGKWEAVPWSGCWIWTRALRGGYGCITDDKGSKQKALKANRVAYELYVGPIPDGMQVLHRCDVRCCVNPSHLFLGTHADNMKDRNAKNRQARQRGEQQGQAKLSWAKVATIRADTRTLAEIAKDYGVVIACISNVKNRKTWVDQPCL